MKHFTLLVMGLCMAFCGVPQVSNAENTVELPDTVITKVPEGTVKHYYANNYILCNDLNALVPQLLQELDIVFTQDGYAYMKSPVLPLLSSGYLKGVVNTDGTQITFPNHQLIYQTPNDGAKVYACLVDKDGAAGNEETNEFYSQDFVLNIKGEHIADNLNQRLGAFQDNITECYDYASLPQLFTKEDVDNNLESLMVKYDAKSDNAIENKSSNASLFRNGDDIYIKGFIPRYSNAWVKLSKITDEEDSLSISSGYVLRNSEYTGITLLYGNNGTKLLASTKLHYDKTTGVIKTIEGENFTGYWFDENGNLSKNPDYCNFEFSPLVTNIAKPANPTSIQFMNRSRMRACFTLSTKDVDGNALSLDNLYYRLFIDGNLYTFKKDDYTHLSEDMTLIPLTFSNGGYPFYYDDATIYLDFENLNLPTTIGVQEVYIVDGHESVSDIREYNVETHKQSITTNIQHLPSIVSNKNTYYDIQGRKLSSPTKGINIVRQSDGRVIKIIKR
jgi:hypothetical protein